MARYVFDIEADGLLDTISRIHSIVLKDIDTSEVFSFHGKDIHRGFALLAEADLIIGHNVIKYDLPAIKQIYPWFETKAQVRDTLVWTRLIWPSDRLMEIDSKNKQPGKLVGRHSLEAWGWRIGHRKMEKPTDFTTWTPEMQVYCEQDVETNHKLYSMLVKQNYSETAIQLEHDVQEIIFRQEQTGVPFDEKKAIALYAALVQVRLEAEKEFAGLFAPWYRPDGKVLVPKRNNKTLGYTAGAPLQHIKLVEFTGSRDQLAGRLVKIHGWKPKAFGSDGVPTIDEKILAALPYPEARKMVRYYLIQKRIGQLAEGKKALLKFVKNGRIHGEVITNGTVTGRAAHANPNLGQVPKVKKEKDGTVLYGEAGLWGFEFRDLFCAPDGWVMVGVDASGLELRMLGSRLAGWDDGAYAREVVSGDIHTLHADALGIARDPSKTWTYAWLYGAGDKKLGTILKAKNPASAGRTSRAVFLHKLPALGHLINAVKHRHQTRKYIIGLDGRHVQTRSDHSALNSLLQSDGSLVVKFWMVALDRALAARGWVHGRDYAQVLYVHDEFQFITRPEHADELGRIAVETIREVGVGLGLRVPLGGEFHVGRTWAETH